MACKAPCFQDPSREIPERAETLGKGLLEERSSWQELEDCMGYLEEEVEDLQGNRIHRVGVLEGVPSGLLRVEALVLNDPSYPP